MRTSVSFKTLEPLGSRTLLHGDDGDFLPKEFMLPQSANPTAEAHAYTPSFILSIMVSSIGTMALGNHMAKRHGDLTHVACGPAIGIAGITTIDNDAFLLNEPILAEPAQPPADEQAYSALFLLCTAVRSIGAMILGNHMASIYAGLLQDDNSFAIPASSLAIASVAIAAIELIETDHSQIALFVAATSLSAISSTTISLAARAYLPTHPLLLTWVQSSKSTVAEIFNALDAVFIPNFEIPQSP